MKKNNSLLSSFKYAFEGIFKTIKTERNIKIHLCVMILVIIFGFIFSITINEWIACIILFGLVISSEIINTAIENLVDLCEPNKNPKAKICKDAAAGAVLFNAIIAAIVGLIIFIPYLIRGFN